MERGAGGLEKRGRDEHPALRVREGEGGRGVAERRG